MKWRDRIPTLFEHAKAACSSRIPDARLARLAEPAALYAKGDVRRTYPFGEAAAAHREIEAGKNRSHVSLIVPRCGRAHVPDFGRWTP
ncbi:hypothetical protein ACGFMK_36830 [Amycolatopsis sp. NPDC049252]|uniref:hypothetical protein n=1 Tax=Amycolatopsis sp. NPDC049252 TaxID=3363933 RepID=UPI0037174F3E